MDTLEKLHNYRHSLFLLWSGEVGAHFRKTWPYLPVHLRTTLWNYALIRFGTTSEGEFLREFTLDFLSNLHDAGTQNQLPGEKQSGQVFIHMLDCISWALQDPSWDPPHFQKVEAAYNRWIDGLAGDEYREEKEPFFEALKAHCHHANEAFVIRTASEMLIAWARVMRKVLPLRAPPNIPVSIPSHPQHIHRKFIMLTCP